MKNICLFITAILLLADFSCKKDSDTLVAANPAEQVSKAKQTLISNSPYLLTEVSSENYLTADNQPAGSDSTNPDKKDIRVTLTFAESNKIIIEKYEGEKKTGKTICFWDIQEKVPGNIRMGHYINQIYACIPDVDYTFSKSTPDVQYNIKSGSLLLKGTLYSASGERQTRHEVTYTLASINR